MMRVFSVAAILLGIVASAMGEEKPRVLVSGLKNPSGIAVGPSGKVYVSVEGEPGKNRGGAVMVIENGKAALFCTGLGRVNALSTFQQWIFAAEKDRIVRINRSGKAEVFAAASAFPKPPVSLTAMTVDPESGLVYVSDVADPSGKNNPIYRITPNGKVGIVFDAKRTDVEIRYPNALLLDGASHLLVTDFGNGTLLRIKLAGGSVETLATSTSINKLTWDRHGRLLASVHRSSVDSGSIIVFNRPGDRPIKLAEVPERAGAICLAPSGKEVLAVAPGDGIVYSIPINIPGWEVDETPLPLKPALAFPDLQWTGWEPETKTGKPNPLRPIALTHAGDGSNRVFVATEQGVIHSFPNDQKATKTNVFLDLTDRVSYRDDQNEEGFLGLCFHPKYKQNGEFFVFYTPKKTKGVNVLSRFRVSKDNPDKADPNSEEVLMQFKKPFWNHDGGTVCFGPDGYLYVTHGDGGAANDPFDNGQNLNSFLGKIHRIDVDHKDPGKNYAIPQDNPFVGRKDAKPEIWSYGHRNIWRMAFDRKTGKLWAGEVGQNLFEEINLIEKGGNFGWNRREGLHPFGPKGEGPSKKFIDPIWEYNHDVGKSITGGAVYRGPRLSVLDGMYIYGDYITNKIWALKYDEAKGRVVANRPVKDLGMPMFSFGEDEKGEMYMLCPATTGKGIFWFERQ